MEQFEFRKKYEGREKVKTIEEFEKLLTDVKADSRDYGAIVEACSVMMNASFNLLNPGITGFQAGCLMWMLVEKYGMYGKDSMLQIQDYRNLLYPQYSDKFNTIPKSYWEKVQAQAKEHLADFKGADSVGRHMHSIANGEVPFGLKVSDD